MIAALSVEVVGDGKTRVVFVHGSGSVDVWSNQLVLADRLPARLEFVRRTS
jgi:hypothetical protein